MSNDIVAVLEGDYYTFECPHCRNFVQVHKNEINCRIFRHAVYKNSLIQVNPHEKKDNCVRLFETGQVFGCCKPFMLVRQTDKYIVKECDYI